AARDGDVAQVKSLLERGVSVDAKTDFDCTALYFAANSNRTDVMRVLLDAGADVDVRDNSYGFSAVGMAAWLGHAEAVEVLIGAGADPGDATGALFAAIGNGHLDVVEVGLKALEIAPAQLTAMLATAERSGQDAVADRLRKAGAKAPEPTAEAPAETNAETVAEPLSPDEMGALRQPKPARAAPWPEFRGPGRSGIADGQHPPLAFDLDADRNVRWRRPIEGLGLSSPIIWGDRIFVTTAISPETEQSLDAGALGNIDPMSETSRHDWRLIAVDLQSGEPLWQQTALSGVPRSQRHWKASQANPTAATDGDVVVAFFGSAGLHAFDLDGKRLWQQDLGRLDAGWYMDPAFEWGFASSPILDGDRVIVQSDVHGTSFVAAYDKATGKQLWRTERDELPSWGTPLVYRDDQHAELVLAATNAIVGYDPANGKELWRLAGNSPITVASPIARDGLIVATGGYRTPKPIYAIKPGGRGDITPEKDAGNAHVAWSTQTDGAYQVTPLLYRGVLYICRDHGVLTAYDPVTGEQLYRQRLRGRFTASPVAADGRIYFTAEDGDVTVVQAGRTFRVLARSTLDATSLATPAISDGLLIFRTVKGLIGVGFDTPKASEQPAP
ncbi:MAG: PQQ-binding-like beta-propeller repeat protein, partial [Acidobacteriota bacterium]